MNGQVYSDGLGDAIVIIALFVLVLIAYYIVYKHPERERKRLGRRMRKDKPKKARTTPTECKANCLMAVYYENAIQELKKEAEHWEQLYKETENKYRLMQDTITKLRKGERK